MATLVLTTIGGALGGPIGAALGALAGNAIDHAVLRPKGREGPRLTELRVQTSSYGAAIPRLFGTMRVAGTVIWSTDLIEGRSTTRAGKGQPSIMRYNYAASFAVLLSARPILGVGRVWADGQLVRGAAGDWKVHTGFRVHLGDEDQAADPLIASAEGVDLTPAHRGCAYAVFEGMALESFGNRLPSLTFEVIADVGPVGVGAIAHELAPEVSGAVALMVDGFAGVGGSVGAVLETLAAASGAWFGPDGDGLAMRYAGESPGAVVTPVDGRLATREVAAGDAAPGQVTVSHYDPGRDWQAGLQRARRPGGHAGAGQGVLTLEVPAAISASVAKGIAEAALLRAEGDRVRRTVPVGLDGLRVAPGAVVTVAGEEGGWRVDEVLLEGMATSLTLRPLAGPTPPVTASAGRVMAQADLPIGRTLLHAVELPGLEDVALSQPRLLVMACGEGAGWRAAALLLSLDEGASWTEVGATAAPAVMGRVDVPPGAGSAALVDEANAILVTLAHAGTVLGDTDDAALDRGANLALLGDELVQWGCAEPLGEGRWRLSRLWRGRRGTVPVAGVAGDRFVVLTPDTVRAIDLPVTALGGTARVMAAGVGDGDTPALASAAVTGASVLPPAPVAGRWTATADGGALVRWTRRSRAGWRWLDRVDVALGEESESYCVTVATQTGSRDLIVAEPVVAVTAAEHGAGAIVTVRQRGVFGESAPMVFQLEEVGR